MSVKDFIKKSVLESDMFTGTSIAHIALGIIAAMLVGAIIYYVYSKFYVGVIYSRSFAITLVGMTMLTTMVTLAISSNIVISLGMVGALSIVRFRTAVKDPLDLLYLFWAITSGITVGAGMYILALLTAIVMIVMIICFYDRQQKGCIYIVIVHYVSEKAGEEILRAFGNMKYHIKSKTMRKDNTELAVEVYCRNNDTFFLDKIKSVPDVEDATLIQYNGEYHG